MLTKNQRTHYILLVDWTQINITEAQYELYKSEVELKQHTKFITINDIDTDEVLFEWRCSEIKRFVERKQDISIQSKAWICSFCVRHTFNWFPYNCTCKKKYNTLWIIFLDEIKAMWYNISSYYQITEEMRETYENRIVK